MAESVPIEDQPAQINTQVVLSPALSKTSVASSNNLAVEPSLETKSAESYWVTTVQDRAR